MRSFLTRPVRRDNLEQLEADDRFAIPGARVFCTRMTRAERWIVVLRGVIVSNHGGRQLDGAIAAIDALPGVVGDGQGPSAPSCLTAESVAVRT